MSSLNLTNPLKITFVLIPPSTFQLSFFKEPPLFESYPVNFTSSSSASFASSSSTTPLPRAAHFVQDLAIDWAWDWAFVQFEVRCLMGCQVGSDFSSGSMEIWGGYVYGFRV
jgi:hypothetical protein